ncbi:DNA methyltransferase [Exiguobacterium sp. ZWU0009]|uniref:DNA methyltransferase n=1 Tax=Exiguobacterium sp. ZWU0009 TaxID=1224749 RepID=UPI00064760EF|nr:DNA methyltransferase [Exiguobacterium sp. ZWU0009]
MDEQEQLFFNSKSETDDQKVVCLGLTFNNDEERRNYFRNELRKKLPQLKEIEGFPLGEDEDIIALSDPPYYTACPNPWLNDFINYWNEEKNSTNDSKIDESYSCEPFSVDISEGKTDPIYLAHSYHTKVPHKAIMRYLMHYTEPGDLVLDGFSGTGMTGVAGALCNNQSLLESMGYDLSSREMENKVGIRKTILNDISPIATFIASNYNNAVNYKDFEKSALAVFDEVQKECSWMFNTYHEQNDTLVKDNKGNPIIGKIEYTVYSDVFECPNCTEEVIFTDVALNKENGSVAKEFKCKSCSTILTKNKLKRIFLNYIDAEGTMVNLAKQIPVLIHYSVGKEKFSKFPSNEDFELINKIENIDIPYWFPKDEIPSGHNLNQPKNSHGLSKIHHFYSKRALYVLAKTFDTINQLNSDIKPYLQFTFEQAILGMSKIARYVPTHYSQVNQYLSGTLYIGSQIVDVSLEYIILNKIKRLVKMLQKEASSIHLNNVISTQAVQSLKGLQENSIDYIFTDPPFGSNLMYSDLNFMWESWSKIKTNTSKETIVNDFQKKDTNGYKDLMQEAFSTYYRVLKPNRWITVEFSNSKASIWNAIQDAMQKSGFIIANVSALNKKQGSFKAVTSSTAVKQDLVISAYKPSFENIKEMQRNENSSESAWIFLNQHLENLPVFSGSKDEFDIIAERTPRILFDRMIAFHVQNGLTIPISSAEFQNGVSQRFSMRDGMAFLESQVAEYDKKRILIKEFSQMTLFVSDENSAIEWIRQQLLKKTQTRQDLHPYFMKEIQHIAKHEQLPELDDLLSQNFLRFDDEESGVPTQILTYLRRNYPDLRGLDASHPAVIKKALHRWYVPDPNKQADLEKLREKALLREFNLYVEEMATSKKKLKVFRTEAIRAGFKKAWSEKEFQTIITVGDRLPETIIQEDDKLLMYYDNAQIKLDM